MNQFKIIRKLLRYTNLDSEVDSFDTIHQSIEKDIVFKGTNLWILVFAIIVASVGLNMNSTAVIIGAMLISPLMGPINGMGYSIATYNFPLFRKAVKNFSFAVAASLLASTTYFAITPISTAHSELLARTSPTIYDVLIALFGGLAGILAISSKQKGNVIPGVAIATALMPPLCTAGYGLATAQFHYFLGAIYLFTINSVFIAIAAVIVSQILNFPIRTIIDASQKQKVNRWISSIITIVLVPSIYFGYVLVQKERFMENAGKYVKSVSVIEGNYLLKHEIDAGKKTINLIYGGMTLNRNQKKNIENKAAIFSLEDAEITFQQGISFDDITQSRSNVEELKAEINRVNMVLLDKDKHIDSLQNRNLIGKQIFNEVRVLYPFITKCAYSEPYVFSSEKTEHEKVEMLVLKSKKHDLSDSTKTIIRNWLKVRLNSDNIMVYFE